MRTDGSITLGRNPYGTTDKEVLVMNIAKPDGVPVGAIFDYATHATSLVPGNMLISGTKEKRSKVTLWIRCIYFGLFMSRILLVTLIIF